jgi:GNAT superfamily N-acetyltransferase
VIGRLFERTSPGETVRLADGAVVTVRQLSPDDVPGLRRLHGRLSQRTLYQRFMTPTPRLSDRTPAYLADVDHVDREALVSLAGDKIIAVARYHRMPDTVEAEIAIVVEDAWQRRGLGRILLERLSARAWRRGVRVFTGSMLAENIAARASLGALFPGAPREVRGSEVVFRAHLRPHVLESVRPGYVDDRLLRRPRAS